MNLPFLIGATSFLYPDRWLPNVERLAGRVDDVEILLFELAGGVPDEAELRALAALKTSAELTYTVHTPLDVSLASEHAAERERAIEHVWRAIELTRPLEPHAYIVHVYLGDRERDTPPADLDAWRTRAHRSLEALLGRGVAPADVCVESLDYDFTLIEPVVEQLGLGVALDVGHPHRDARSARALLARNLSRTRVIQWHGTDPSGRDHRSLRHYPTCEARWLLGTLIEAGYAGVLTLEVFREADFEESLAIVRSLVAEVAA